MPGWLVCLWFTFLYEVFVSMIKLLNSRLFGCFFAPDSDKMDT